MEKLMIVMVNTDPRHGSELGAPFFQATVAAAMEFDVEVVITGGAGELVKKGVPENLYVQEGSDKSVYDFIADAAEAGVSFKACTPALDLLGVDKSGLIDEVEEVVGGAYVITQAMDEDTCTMTY
ncbi:DsrE/DsrF/DrsH-like family protein [Thiohalorhabdus sp.]|uniref:DsrE/DsrF/DrsH-like family protein n=1 Tax=Thiohalorhabdus sp. TaxID=3094134 RepID=UPI002FC28D07